MTKTTKVHFTVDPDGLTSLVRDMWGEGNFSKCLSILEIAKHGDPIPVAIQHDIIRGKKRFARVKGSRSKFCIKEDNWEPSNFSYYPDPASLPKLAEKVRGLELDAEDRHAVERREEMEEECGADIMAAAAARGMKRFGGFDSLEEMNQALLIQRNLPTLDEVLQAQDSRDKRESQGKPKPDRKLEAWAGWIRPDGLFYACLTKMEHIWLAGQFDLSEQQAEGKGWIKITRDLTGQTYIFKGKQEPTQKQINTVFDWCEKHKHPLPEWAGGKP